MGQRLRATVSYTDALGAGKSASAVTGAVAGAALPRLIKGPFIASTPDNGDTYGAGEDIVVAFTFSEKMYVDGMPYVVLKVGGRDWWVPYSQEDDGKTTLTFPYEVKPMDVDADGVSVERQMQFKWGNIADTGYNVADVTFTALADQSGHKVNGSPNRAPRFGASRATRSVAEDAPVGVKVGNPVTASDADGDTLTYALSGAGPFAINGDSGQITLAGALDSRTRSSYALTVAVTDGRNAFDLVDASVDATIAVTVNVNAVNAVNADQAGVVSLDYETDPPEVGGQLLAVLLDPDGVTGDVAWSWWRDDAAAIAGATGDTYTATAEDAGKFLRAMASYADGHGPGKTAYGPLAGPVAQAVTPAQPPSQPQTPGQGGNTVWSATLTVDEVSEGSTGIFGCGFGAQDPCSTALTKNSFSYGGATYTLEDFYWTSDNRLTIALTSSAINQFTGDQAKAALAGLTLRVDSHNLAINAAQVASGTFPVRWSFDPEPDWTDGQKVNVSLIDPLPTYSKSNILGADQSL